MEFSTTEWYSDSGILSDGRIFVTVKTADDLNALSSPPPTPFTVTATATMTNDEGETATGTFTFETYYAREESITPVVVKPTFRSQDGTVSLPLSISTLYALRADLNFDNAGTNPRFTDVTFSTTEWYSESGITNGVIWIKTKTAAELNALASPPPNPFTVTVTATMTNDEGQTASGTFALETTYARTENTPSTPSGPAPTPVHSTREAPVAVLLSHWVSYSFTNAGTNAKFTDVTFDKPEYLDVPPSGNIETASNGDTLFWLRTKTSEQLRALFSPPPSPFTVKATVKMTNDEGHTGTGTVTFTTNYVTQIADLPESVTPSPSSVDVVKMPPGTATTVDADSLFDNPGTNPRFTAVVLSTREYYATAGIAQSGNAAGEYVVQVKSLADLKAMDSLPASPIEVTATVTMINDEGATGTRTVTFETAYGEDEESEAEEPTAEPTAKSSPAIRPGFIKTLSAGGNTTLYAAGFFQNVGTNPRLTSVSFSTMEYFRSGSGLNNGAITVLVKSAADLSALADPPSSPFTVTATVEMTNDEGETATGTISYKITYVKPSPPPPPPEGLTPKELAVLNVPPGSDIFGTTASAYFHNVGTNARLTGATFSTLDYYKKRDTGIWGGKLYMVVKTASQLRALAPPNPFTVDVTLTMTNDEGETATNTLTIQTTYDAN
ncbi:MAG: hypothetical protein OXE86_02220 [Alphaproteobacteria bacterium]|nr:hypothetical protein [Alphaproteobacteria bacterium]